MYKHILFTMLGFIAFRVQAQREPCDPQCNVTIQQISAMRTPDEGTVAGMNNLTVSEYSFKPDKVTLGGPHCGDKAAALLRKFRERDAAESRFLLKRYCSAMEGWVPDGDCVHGGPPPCCTAPAERRPWKRIAPAEALRRFKAEQAKVYQERLKEIESVVRPCRIQAMQDAREAFDQQYKEARQSLEQFKKDYPAAAANAENSSGARISQLLQQYNSEAAKGEKADPEKLNRYAAEMEKEKENLNEQAVASAKKKEEEDKQLAEKKEKEELAARQKAAEEEEKEKEAETAKEPEESPYAREMRLRREAQYNRDSVEDKNMTAMMATTGGLMAAGILKGLDNEDEDDELSLYLKGTIGLGLQQIPVTANMRYGNYNYSTGTTTYSNESETRSTNNYSVDAGLLFAVMNNRFVSFRLSPFFSYGTNAFVSGTTGSHFIYGSGAAIGLGKKFKLMLRGEYIKRSGDMYEDNAVIGIDATGYSSYSYSTLRAGAGFYVGLGGHDSFLEATVWREQVSFLKNTKAEVYAYSGKFSFGLLAFAVQYAPNYPIAGEVAYPATHDKEKENFLSLSMYVPVKLISKK